MGKRSGIVGAANAMAREAAKQAKQAEAEKKRLEREAAKRAREAERAKALADKEAKQRYLEERNTETESLNKDIASRVEELEGIIKVALGNKAIISFDSLRIKEKYPKFNPPKDIALPAETPNLSNYSVDKPTFFRKLLPGATKRYHRSIQNAERLYHVDVIKHENYEAIRKSKLAKLQAEYDKGKQAFLLKVQQKDQEVNELQFLYSKGVPEAVVTYNTMVLECSKYPNGFPQYFRLAYVQESKELVIEYELPTKDIIPQVAEYKYVKSKDEINKKSRKIGEIKSLYQDIVSAITLRTLHEVFEADQGNVVEVVVINGFVQTIDPATGKDITPYLISVRVTKDTFTQLDLSRVDKIICLRNLGAQVSPRPTELLAVKPIVEFNMVDKRFVDQSDVIETLDSRPNLMDLNPYEFENLVSNLFGKMGLDSKQTRSSRDGGVDAVAFDKRPIVGGKVVIQAKRYKNPVGVSAVRDLYGTMMNEGANKGILVTTSGYGPDAYDFANDKPIELIDGSGLLYLLDQNGYKARIIFPEDKK